MPQAERLRAKKEALIALIADEDTVTGFLLSGIGNIDQRRNSNFLIVTNKTTTQEIETAFKEFTKREDVGILLITQNVAETIRYLIEDFELTVPTILEIPSKDAPYDPRKDSVMQRVMLKLGVSDM